VVPGACCGTTYWLGVTAAEPARLSFGTKTRACCDTGLYCRACYIIRGFSCGWFGAADASIHRTAARTGAAFPSRAGAVCATAAPAAHHLPAVVRRLRRDAQGRTFSTLPFRAARQEDMLFLRLLPHHSCGSGTTFAVRRFLPTLFAPLDPLSSGVGAGRRTALRLFSIFAAAMRGTFYRTGRRYLPALNTAAGMPALPCRWLPPAGFELCAPYCWRARLLSFSTVRAGARAWLSSWRGRAGRRRFFYLGCASLRFWGLRDRVGRDVPAHMATSAGQARGITAAHTAPSVPAHARRTLRMDACGRYLHAVDWRTGRL